MFKLILKSWFCKECPYRSWSSDIEFRAKGWHWCPIQEDMIHISMGCEKRLDDYRYRRIALAVRVGLKPNEQGEYLS